MIENYSDLLNTKTGNIWKKIGINRKAGIAVPLYSIISENSAGCGEITDLKLLAKWCKLTGMSIIQLLPLNYLGNDFSPYNSLSSFALDPIYLNLNELKYINNEKYKNEINTLRKYYKPFFGKINYNIKDAKINLLWNIYKENQTSNIDEFNSFKHLNSFWLNDFALFIILTDYFKTNHWNEWDNLYKFRNQLELEKISKIYFEQIEFTKWIQWQLYEQFIIVKNYINNSGMFLMGDLPFLVSYNSADVWSKQNYFMLNLSSGAPPDMYFAKGQKWGMPPYNWNNIAEDNFIYIKKRLEFAGNFYDMYRIDHFVGLFRIWVTSNSDNELYGSFLPKEEYLWEAHGKKIIDVMVNSSSMLPCAEDLGTVPSCSYHVLQEYGITGIDFQRYYKNNFEFIPPEHYRINSAAVLSTHDSSFWINWWKFEAGTIDELLFEILCDKIGFDQLHVIKLKRDLFDENKSNNGRLYWKDEIFTADILLNILNIDFTKTQSFIYLYLESYMEKTKYLNYLHKYTNYTQNNYDLNFHLIYNTLKLINNTKSIFSIQLLQDYLALDEKILKKIGKYNVRINTPGSINKNNWSRILPVSLENLLSLEINSEIYNIIRDSNRL